MKKLNKSTKKRICGQMTDLVRPYASHPSSKNKYGEEFFYFDSLPSDIAEKLLTGEPNISPRVRMNNSPTQYTIIKISRLYRGTVEGFVRKFDREGSEIVVTGFSIHAPESEAYKLYKKYKPDEFGEFRPGYYRFWWD